MNLSMFFGRTVLTFVCIMHTNIVFAEKIAYPLTLSKEQLIQYQQNNFKILGVVQFKRQSEAGKPITELSGLAWDTDDKILYAVSDRGYVLHLIPDIQDQNLKSVILAAYYPLEDANGRPLNGIYADSEGITLINHINSKINDTELLISFERKPRIIRYTTKGEYISEMPLNKALKDIKHYSGSNKALEAITMHKTYGIITGPERPLKTDITDLSLHSQHNHKWLFKPDNDKYGSLVGMSSLPDDRIILLERIFPGVFSGVTNVIHLVELSNSNIKQEKLLKLLPVDAFFNDNFEGISWHERKRFFMISDDNDNLLQRTVLVYFEIPKLGMPNDD